MPLHHITTIGFTKTTAENFFGRLLSSGVTKVVDVRLNNTSQLSGFAKAKDLSYFLRKLGNIGYSHQPSLAPTDIMLKAYRKGDDPWNVYEKKFMNLISERKIEEKFNPEMLDGVCLLCSEDTPHHCHRRLVVEYLNGKWGKSLSVKHL